MGFFANGAIVEQVATTLTSGTPYPMNAASLQVQNFTGSTAQTLKLPPTTTMYVGQFYEIYNNSSASMTIEYQDGTSFTLQPTLAAGISMKVTLISSGTTNGTWTTLNATVGGIVAIANGGTGQSSFSSGALFSNGTIISSGALPAADGGTGISTSSSTGVPVITVGTWTVDSTLPITLGGTGESSITTGGTGGSSSPAIASGSYLPTVVSQTTVTGTTPQTWQWMRVGNVVTVSGAISFSSASPAGFAVMSLPTTTANFSNSSQAAGTMAGYNGAALSGIVQALSSSQNASFYVLNSFATTSEYFFTFAYQVQ